MQQNNEPHFTMKKKEIETKHRVVGYFPYQIASFNPQVFCIEQQYLTDGEFGERRIRRVICPEGKFSYFYTEKFPTEDPRSRDEIEQPISTQEYEILKITESHPNCRPILKYRYVFTYTEQVFELDVFSDPLNGLVTLECEVGSLEALEKIIFPPTLNLFDLKGDKRFSNRSLAEHGILDLILDGEF